MTLTIDQAGVELIAGFEGFVNGAYNDSQGYATCGYGHLLHRSRATAQDYQRYDHLTRTYFLGLLHADIERVSMAPMRAAIHVGLSQNQINALASLCFNCGPGPLYGTVGRLVNARDWLGAANAFLAWSHPAVLLPRRRTERALFLHTTTIPLPWLTATERRWCLEYDKLLQSRSNARRRRSLRAAMHGQAVKIAVAARHGGWDVSHRRERYHSLVARSS